MPVQIYIQWPGRPNQSQKVELPKYIAVLLKGIITQEFYVWHFSQWTSEWFPPFLYCIISGFSSWFGCNSTVHGLRPGHAGTDSTGSLASKRSVFEGFKNPTASHPVLWDHLPIGMTPHRNRFCGFGNHAELDPPVRYTRGDLPLHPPIRRIFSFNLNNNPLCKQF